MKFLIFLLSLFFPLIDAGIKICSQCCKPTQSVRPLALAFDVTMVVILIAVLFFFLRCRSVYKSKHAGDFQKTHWFYGNIPVSGSYPYKSRTMFASDFDWREENQIEITFIEGAIIQIKGPLIDFEGNVEGEAW